MWQAISFVAEKDPTVGSKLWKQFQSVTELLGTMPLTDLDALRENDVAKVRIFEDLAKAVERVKKETNSR